MRNPYPKLFEPIVIRGRRVPNRVAMCAMNDNMASPDGYPTQHEIDYYAARAAGGVGFLITGNAFIDEDVSKISSTQLGCQGDWVIPGLARLAESVQSYGSIAIVQLAHAGVQTRPETIAFRRKVAPTGGEGLDAPHELAVAEIETIVKSFIAAAGRAQRAGFDGSEIHCAHGYLLSGFISPNTNRRTDAYGGSFENRMRIIRGIFEGARERVGPDFILGAKLNSSDLVEGGLMAEEGVEVAKALEAMGADYLGVSRGVGGSADEMMAPLYYGRLENVPAARRIRDSVSIPVIAMGAIMDPAEANVILERGDADLVAIGRALIADPDWATKARHGLSDDVRPCIRCNECVSLVDENREVRCAVNPIVGREAQDRLSAADPQKVVVLGGGPAGCEAALVAARRGHHVTLIERRERLGGASVPRENPDFKRELNRLPVWYERQLQGVGVGVKLNTLASRELVEALEPDVVVFALGAEPIRPDVQGIGGENVVQAVDLLDRLPPTGEDVLVVGAGFVGCETALHLARSGNRVRLCTRRSREQLAPDLNETMKLALLKEMARAGVEIVDEVDIERIEAGRVVVRPAGLASDLASDRELLVDLVVLARGFQPRHALADELIRAGFDVRIIGESARPGLIFHAVQQGFAVGNTI